MPDASSTGHLHTDRFKHVQHPDAAKIATNQIDGESKPFGDHIKEATNQIANMKRQAEGFISAGGAAGAENPNQIANFLGGNPLQMGGLSGLGGEGSSTLASGAAGVLANAGAAGQINADNPILDAFLDGFGGIQSAMGKLGENMHALVQMLMAGLKEGQTSPNHISKWDSSQKAHAIQSMKQHSHRLVDAHKDIAAKERLPLGPAHRQELDGMARETETSISVFAASFVHFSMEGYVEAGDGLIDLHKELDKGHESDEPGLAAQQAAGGSHHRMMFSFEMTVVSFFQMTVTQKERVTPEVDDKVKTIQDRLHDYLQGADSESASRILAKIEEILNAEEASIAEELASEIVEETSTDAENETETVVVS